MSLNSIMIEALESVAPVYPDSYNGDKLTYIVFNYSTRGAIFADDAPGCELYAVQVHYFCPSGVSSLSARETIKNQLFLNGFTWPEEINATDDEGQHFVFECERLGVDADG